ncbi:uncharacterized protein [Dermacentor albipictus]|uniref:uncharacterized protein isoform X2 n=1 Tax=Dermacentor albipictus TaxID=60249 RepID=UPI0038FCA3CA
MAYVYDKVRWRSEIVTDALTDTLVHWYELGATFLEKQRRPSPASALYQGCVSRKGHTYERLEEVLSFLRDRGLHWPQRVTGVGATKHALNVILDLLINWGVPFWLEISLKQLPGDTRYSLHMAYSEVSVHRAKWLNYSKAYGKRLEYVRSMYRLYGAGDTPLAQLRDLVADEDAWVRAVTEGIASSNRVIMKLRLAHLDQLTPNVSSHRWLDYLNDHLRPHRLSPDDNLLLVDKIVSTVTNNIFESFSNAAILEQVAWRFIEDYSYANSYAAAVATFGNREAVARFRPRKCYSFTESRFQKWLFVWRVGEQLQPRFLNTVKAIFEDLRNTTQRLLSDAAPWIDPAARIEAVAILERLHMEPFWSLFGAEGFKPMLPPSAIHKYLDAFPRQFSSPLKGWMQLHASVLFDQPPQAQEGQAEQSQIPAPLSSPGYYFKGCRPAPSHVPRLAPQRLAAAPARRVLVPGAVRLLVELGVPAPGRGGAAHVLHGRARFGQLRGLRHGRGQAAGQGLRPAEGRVPGLQQNREELDVESHARRAAEEDLVRWRQILRAHGRGRRPGRVPGLSGTPSGRAKTLRREQGHLADAGHALLRDSLPQPVRPR